MKGRAVDLAGTKIARATGTAAGDTVVTLASAAGEQHVIDWINCSYDTPSATNGALTIVINGTTTIYKTFVRPATGVNSMKNIPFSPGLECGVGASVAVTLGGLTSLTGELNVGYR